MSAPLKLENRPMFVPDSSVYQVDHWGNWEQLHVKKNVEVLLTHRDDATNDMEYEVVGPIVIDGWRIPCLGLQQPLVDEVNISASHHYDHVCCSLDVVLRLSQGNETPGIVAVLVPDANRDIVSIPARYGPF